MVDYLKGRLRDQILRTKKEKFDTNPISIHLSSVVSVVGKNLLSKTSAMSRSGLFKAVDVKDLYAYVRKHI